MKMYKKAIMLLLALVVLFAAGVVASADTATNVSDDFNVYTTTQSFTKGYPNNGYTSDVLQLYYHTATTTHGYFHIVPESGPDGSTALRINATSFENNSILRTIPYDSTTGNTAILSYDICIIKPNGYNGTNTSTRVLSIGAGRSQAQGIFSMPINSTSIYPVSTTSDNGGAYEYEFGKWYRVIIVRDGTTLTGYFTDRETGEVYTYASNTSSLIAEDYMILVFSPPIVGMNTFDAYVDNIEMKVYNPAEDAPSVNTIDVTDGETDVLLNKEITVEFDQVFFDGTPEPVVLKGDAPVSTTVEKLTDSKVKIKFNALLERNTEYTISFDEVSNGTMPCNTGDITFTTEDLHLWNDVEIAPVEAGPVTDLQLTIGEEYGYPTFTGKALVMVYRDGVMTSITPLALTAENITETLYKDVPLGILESGDEIKVVLVDDVNGIVPLALGSTTVQ